MADCESVQQILLEDVTSFLSKESGEKSSTEDRTDSATVLLQSLPCARYAVLEKIGEVFFNEAYHYTVDVEKEQLEGLPQNFEPLESKRSSQIKKIQHVLSVSIDANSKAWAPMIFQWAVQTLSQICNQYGTKRSFASFTLEERFDLWLNCTATKTLLEITISCLHKIIQKNQDNCLKRLLNATLSCAPYFDWALAHISSVFSNIVPYKFLSHSLEAFSVQSRKTDMLVETMLVVFRHIKQRHNIEKALEKLFTESLVEEDCENHLKLCTVPFILHITIKSNNLFMPLLDTVLNSFLTDYKSLHVLEKQSLKRDAALQRGLLRRLIDCIEMTETSAYGIVQFLLKYVCKEDETLERDNPTLLDSLQRGCTIVMELLIIQLNNDVYHCNTFQMTGDKKIENLSKKCIFLSSLSKYTKQLCLQMFNSTQLKQKYLHSLLVVMAKQEGFYQMREILTAMFLNTNFNTCHANFLRCTEEFQISHSGVLAKTAHHLLGALHSTNTYSDTQKRMLLHNILVLLDDKKQSLFKNLDMMRFVPSHITKISKLLVTMPEDNELLIHATSLLKMLIPQTFRVSNYAVVSQDLVALCMYHIKKLKVLNNMKDFDITSFWLHCSKDLLALIITHYNGVQQFIIRLLLEGFLDKDEEITEKMFELPLVKAELLEKNCSLVKNNRFAQNNSAVCFQDGLRLNKRKRVDISTRNSNFVRQFQVSILSHVLSLTTVHSEPPSDHVFARTWAECKFKRIYPTTYVYTAGLLVELVCPELIPITPWPDEDFLKYTIERDLKIQKAFSMNPILWEVLKMISMERPALLHCCVIVQSLLGMMLQFWMANRLPSSKASPCELDNTTKLMYILKNCGWLPHDFEDITEIFPLIQPSEIFEILSSVWKYLQSGNYAPGKFIEKDDLGRPCLPPNADLLHQLRAVIKVIFLRNMSELGRYYCRFLPENAT